MRQLDIKAKENKALVKKILKKLRMIHKYFEKIISLYIDENDNILVNVDCGVNSRYFFHLWLDGAQNVAYINKYLWGSFLPISDTVGRIDCEFRFPICGKTNNGCYLYDIKRGKDIICLTSLGDFIKTENSEELEAEATITIKGDFYIAFKINSSGKITTPIASNVNDSLIDPNTEGFDLTQCIENLKQEVNQLLSIERKTCLENIPYVYKPNALEGEL